MITCALVGVLVLLAYLVGAGLCSQAAPYKDGLVINLTFNDSFKYIMYEAQPLDPASTNTVIVYENEGNAGEVTTYICADFDCIQVLRTFTGFDAYDFKTYDTENGLDFRTKPYFVKFASTSSANVNIVIMSSTILEDEVDYTINPKVIADDGFDWKANNYKRYYRFFVCDDDDENNPGSLSFVNKLGLMDAYVNVWNSSGKKEPGKPGTKEEEHDAKSSTNKMEITTIKNFQIGWFFLLVDLSRLMAESGLEDDDYDIGITVTLEEPNTPITPDAAYSTDLCVYQDCFEYAYFNTADYINMTASDEEDDFDTLTFLVMLTDKHIHEYHGVISLEATGTPRYDPVNVIEKSGTDNLIEFTQKDVKDIKDAQLENIFVAIQTSNFFKFPVHAKEQTHLNITTTVLKDAQIVRPVGKAVNTTLVYRKDYENENPVFGQRMIFNAVGLNKVEYVELYDASGNEKDEVYCDYHVIARKSNSSTSGTAKLHAGLYIGNGSAGLPNYILDENNEKTGNDYLYQSKSIKKDTANGIPYDAEVISILNSDSTYYKDGAYILDIYDENCSTSDSGKTGISVDADAFPSWVLKPNEEYYKILSGSSTYDYFTFETTDISKGINIYAEILFASEIASTVNIYVSFTNPLPHYDSTSTSKFFATGNYWANLYLSKDDFSGATQTDGKYRVYIAIDTLHNGELRVECFEGIEEINHIDDGESTKVTINNDGSTKVVMLHSSDNENTSDIIFTFEGTSTSWPDSMIVRICVSSEFYKDYFDCVSSGHNTGLSSRNKKNKITIRTETGDSETRLDYYAHIYAQTGYHSNNSDGMVQDDEASVEVKVFGEDFSELTTDDSIYTKVDSKLEPIVMKFTTLYGNDYTVKLTSPESSTLVNSLIKVRVCAGYPAESISYPPDVDDDNVRHCETESYYSKDGYMWDIIGDLVVNESTFTNDEEFIEEEIKYLTIFPSQSSVGTKILATLFEETHIRANSISQMIRGEEYETTYFRLHILSLDSSSTRDMIEFDFESDNVIHYCVSATPHMAVDSADCIKKNSGDVKNDSQLISITDIDAGYDGKKDVYVYFSIFFPDGTSSKPESLLMWFNNSVVHHLDIIKHSNDNIDADTYFFELIESSRFSFFIDSFDYNHKYRFFVFPDVEDSTIYDYVNDYGSYTTKQIAVTHTTDKTKPLPKPEPTTIDLSIGGIGMVDYKISKPDNDDGTLYFATSVQFRTTYGEQHGLYKVGFVDLDDEVGHIISNTTKMNSSQTYKFRYDKTNTKDTNQQKSKMFYYDAVTSDMVIKVYTCAGIPGVYSSYMNHKPSYEDDTFSIPNPRTTHKLGRNYDISFFDINTNDDIDIATGFMFNATCEGKYYVGQDNPDEDTRWDAEMRVVNGRSIDAYGGPKITLSDIVLKEQREAEITIEFFEAVSGYSADPKVTDTHIEYALYAIPAPDTDKTNPYFDASPYSHCGMINYGIPLTTDGDDNVKWTSGTVDTDADGDNPDSDKIVQRMSLISSYNPKDFKYNGIRPNRNDSTTNYYNVNVVAREVKNNAKGSTDPVLGYSVYSPIKIEISGSLPLSPGGLFAHEVVIIVIVIIVVIILAGAVVYYCIRKKQRAMGYGNLDGHGNTSKHGLNIDLPDDDLSISASSVSSRSLTGNHDKVDELDV